MTISRIPFNHKVEGKRQAAFVILWAKDGIQWKDYSPIGQRNSLMIPTCLMINRSYGDIGFVGGKVEKGESLETAAIREVLEEIGFTIVSPLEEIVAHDLGEISLTTHAFACELTYQELRKIQVNAVKAQHFGSEVTGVFLPHLVDYPTLIGDNGGLREIVKANMAPSVRAELVHFLLKKEIVDRDLLETMLAEADYSLTHLLE